MNIKKNDKIFIAGHKGMVGSAILRVLQKKKYTNIITKEKKNLNLTDQNKVENFFKKEKIKQVYLCAAKVGGILANDHYRADFIEENLLIQTNVIVSAFKNGVKNLVFLGSSCVYPVIINRKITEKDLLSSYLEPTNEPYAVAKISGIKLCENYNRQYKMNYKAVMPCNLFGPGDNFHPTKSHVMAALIRKILLAKNKKLKNVVLWGDGSPKREFLYVDDLAEAVVFIGNLSKKKIERILGSKQCHINIGYEKDYSIKNIVKLIARSLNYKGDILFDKSKPNGVKKKLLNSDLSRKLGWKPNYNFEEILDLYVKKIYKNKKLF